jgi:hypothetical protein
MNRTQLCACVLVCPIVWFARIVFFSAAHDASKQRQKAEQERQERHRQQQARERQLRRHSMDGHHRPSPSASCSVIGPHNSTSSTHGSAGGRSPTRSDRVLRPLQRHSNPLTTHTSQHRSSSRAQDAESVEAARFYTPRHSHSHSPTHEHQRQHRHSSDAQVAAADGQGQSLELLGAAVRPASDGAAAAETALTAVTANAGADATPKAVSSCAGA